MMRHEIKLFAYFAVAMVCVCLVGSAASYGLVQMVDAVHSGSGPGGHDAEADLYVKPEPNPLKADYPELFRTEAVVVAFGSPTCYACRKQAAALRGPSTRYNILKVDARDENGKRTRWAELMDEWELGSMIPVVVVFDRETGKITKTFSGYTPWSKIKPHAAKAKKDDNDEKGHVDIGPIHIDWDDGDVNVDIWGREWAKPY